MFTPTALAVLVGSLVALGPAPTANNPQPTPAPAANSGWASPSNPTPPAAPAYAPAPAKAPAPTNTPAAAPPASAPTPPAAPTPAATTSKPSAPKLLVPGDAAPSLMLGTIIKGTSLTGLAKGKVYVVDFWASWAGTCRPVFAHLSQLQSQYANKDLVVLGITDEDAGTARKFIESITDEVSYTIATDNEGRMTNFKWMHGRNELPVSFIVDRTGTIAWIGHPFELASPLAQVIDGTFDASKFAATQAKVKALRDEASKLFRTGPTPNYTLGLSKLDEIVNLDPAQAASVGTMKFQVLLMGKKDYTAAYALAKQLGETTFAGDKDWLNATAWTIAEAPSLAKRDFAVADTLITRAMEITKRKDAEVLDTAARVKWAMGDKQSAIELQRTAIMLAPEDRKAEMELTLEKYAK